MNYGFDKYDLSPFQHFVRSKLTGKTTYLNTSQVKKVETLKDPKYYLALVAIFRNDAPFLKEWIEFYKLLGVEHFYLYDHLSTDNFEEVLQPYVNDGSVELYHLTSEPKTLKEWNALQTQVYTEIVQDINDTVEWLVVVDTDEFLFPLEQEDLKSVLKKYDEYASLSITWKLFGSGDVKQLDKEKLLIESLLVSDKNDDYTVKSIVKPRYVKKFDSPHFPTLKPGHFQITENFVFFKGPFSPELGKNILRINHYWARDQNFFESTKLARIHVLDQKLSAGEKQSKIENLIEMNKSISSKYDGSILNFVPKLRLRMGMTAQ